MYTLYMCMFVNKSELNIVHSFSSKIKNSLVELIFCLFKMFIEFFLWKQKLFMELRSNKYRTHNNNNIQLQLCTVHSAYRLQFMLLVRYIEPNSQNTMIKSGLDWLRNTLYYIEKRRQKRDTNVVLWRKSLECLKLETDKSNNWWLYI